IVLTDIKTGASFPTQHPLHPFTPSLYVTGAAAQLVRDADVILSLDWIDLGGTLLQVCAGEAPRAKVVQCSMDQYIHNGWNADYQTLPTTDLSILAPPDTLVDALLDELGARSTNEFRPWFTKPEEGAPASPATVKWTADVRLPLDDL